MKFLARCIDSIHYAGQEKVFKVKFIQHGEEDAEAAS